MLHGTIRNVTWDQALFSFRFENDIPAGKTVAVRENVWEPLKLGLISGYSQRRFLPQHSVAMLEQCCNHSKQCRNNVATLCCAKNRCCESSRVTSPLKPCAWCSGLDDDHQFINKWMLPREKHSGLQRIDAIQLQPPFLLLDLEEDKRRLCSQADRTITCYLPFFVKLKHVFASTEF